MFKKIAFAAFGLVLAFALASPPKAQSQEAMGVQIGGASAVVFTSGYHNGYYYENGYRYQRDASGDRHYDQSYGGHTAADWKNDTAHKDGNHNNHDANHPDGDHRDYQK